MVSHHPATFSRHKHCISGDTMFSVCHEISQNHLTKGWSNIIGRIPSWQVTSFPSLVAIGTVVLEI